MNTANTTPPHRTIKSLAYNPFKFEKIISQMTTENVFNISIEVWAEDQGKCIELLRSGLSGKEFDAMAAKATTMIFNGPTVALRVLGVA